MQLPQPAVALVAEYSLLDNLDAEWLRLTRQRAWLREYDKVAQQGDLARYRNVNQLVERLRGPDQEHDDVILAELLRARPNPCALRVILHAFMPTLRRITRAHRRYSEDRLEIEAVVTGAAWERITTYPLAARPSRIAANISLDVQKKSMRQLTALRTVIGVDAGRVAAPPDLTADEQLIVAVSHAVRSNQLTAHEAGRLLEFELAGKPIDAIADATNRSWRYTRDQLAHYAIQVRRTLR